MRARFRHGPCLRAPMRRRERCASSATASPPNSHATNRATRTAVLRRGWQCAMESIARASERSSCRSTQRRPGATDVPVPKNPGVAAVLSAVIPGIGQFYNGDFLRGIFWLIVTPGFWLGTGGLLGWVCHVIAAYTAYRRAEWHNMPIVH